MKMNQFDMAYNKDLTNDFDYKLLSRLQSDCKYYLGQGNKCEKYLWAGNTVEQIEKMKELYNKLSEKPEWCTWNDILQYEKLMCPQVNDTLAESVSAEDISLVVEHCAVINESFGKWMKNTFTKFGKKSVQAELQKTIKEFIAAYKFKRFDPEKPKVFGKIQQNYLITIKFNLTDWKHAEAIVNLISLKSKKTIQDFKNIIIPIKHSNTIEEIANKINAELSEIDIEINTNAGKKIPEDFFTTNNVQSQSNVQQKTNEAFNKVAASAGFDTNTFKEKLNQFEGDNSQIRSTIKLIISGWNKFDENERKIFQQLQE